MAGLTPTAFVPGRNTTGRTGRNSLAVQVGHGIAQRPVTVPCPSDLVMSWTVPGGDDTLTCTISWPDKARARPDAFTQGMPIRVVDRRTGEIQWSGRIADPGYTGYGISSSYRVSAVGWRTDLDGMWTVKNYIDRDMTNMRWLADFPAGQASTGDGTGFVANSLDPSAIVPTSYVELPIPNGAPVPINTVSTMEYINPRYANPPTDPVPQFPYIDAFGISWKAQGATANCQMRVFVANDPLGATTLISTVNWPGVQTDFIWSGYSQHSTRLFYIQWFRNGASYTQGAPDTWLRLANMIVTGRRYDRYGNQLTPIGDLVSITGRDIVEDLLGTTLAGRIQPGTVATTSTLLIQQACWYDGCTPTIVLDACVEVDPDYWWAVWAEPDPGSLPRLDWRSWSVPPRYTVTDQMELTLQGGGEQVANRALITFRHPNGITPTTTTTSLVVPAVGRTYSGGWRDTNIDLLDKGPMPIETALQLGVAALAEQAVSTTSGTASVVGALLDDATGKTAQPWEVRPGWPVRLGATPQRYNGTNGPPDTPNQETVFRLTSVSYSASSNSAELHLDGGKRTLFYVRPHVPRTYAQRHAHDRKRR